MSANEKVMYLTFDDGPIPEITPKVLTLLQQYEAKASFFMVGENVVKHPEIYKQVLREGHSIGHHCYNHLPYFKVSSKAYYRNVLKGNEIINSNLFRPPHGQIGLQAMRTLSKRFKIVMWSVMSYDFDKKLTPEQCAQNVISNAKAGSIIVFHDSLKAEKNMLFALEKTLIHFKKEGYQFKAIEDLSNRHCL